MAGNAVRIVVAGEENTGNSTLIVTAATGKFPCKVPPVLPPTRFRDSVPITIIDTGSKNKVLIAEELKSADAVVLTYACDKSDTIDKLSGYWLPLLNQLQDQVPVIVVGCKLDRRGGNHPLSMENVMPPIMQRFREIETCIECSALNNIKIGEVFYYAQKAVLYPIAPLFDQEQQILKIQCVRALKRIFLICDRDNDKALSDAELNDFQASFF